MKKQNLQQQMKKIEKYEKERKDKRIKENILNELWELIKNDYDSYEIRKCYKETLKSINKYSENYYARICICLNVMVAEKERLKQKEKIVFEDLKTIRQEIAGTIETKIKNKQITTRYIKKQVEYEKIYYKEGIGIKHTEKKWKELIEEANELLSQERLDLEQAKKWVAKYKKYIIITYGRWSKQYEKYMNTAFEMPIILTSPNILLLAMRETMKKGIKNAIEKI